MGDRLQIGLIQVYTGNGKGKSTAAFGQAIRAVGAGLKVAIIQFLKFSKGYSEHNALSLFKPNVSIESFGRQGFIDKSGPLEEDYKLAQEAFQNAIKKASDKEVDLLILDELNIALYYNLIDINSVLSFLKNKPRDLEIIITGRYASPEIIKIADLVTEMKEIKHPYEKGLMARKGIEY